MRRITRSSLGIAAVLAAVAFSSGAAPSSVAPDRPEPLVAANADSFTKTYAAEHPDEVATFATVCGGKYQLASADPMPAGVDPNSKDRKGTLFDYNLPGDDKSTSCAIFDNNTGSKKYMVLESCPSQNTEHGANCDVDKGDFTDYAGPTYTSKRGIKGTCWSHYTYMKDRATGKTLINSGMSYGYVCP